MNDIEIHKGQIFLGTDDGLYVQEQGIWKPVFESEEDLIFIQSSNDRLITGWMTGDFSSTTRFFDDDFNFITSGNGCHNLLLGAIRDESGRIWYAEGFSSIRQADNYELGCDLQSFVSSRRI